LTGISIIVPIYNTNRKFLTECIASIDKQTHTDFELILVDDGSTEKPFIKPSITLEKNVGVASAVNAGLDLVTKEWMIVIDSDDYVDRTFLETAALKMNNVDCLRIGMIVTDGVKIMGKIEPKYTNKVFIKTEIFKKYRMQSGLRRGEDVDLCNRLSKTDIIMRELPGYLYYYRRHGNSLSQQPDERVIISKSLEDNLLQLATLYHPRLNWSSFYSQLKANGYFGTTLDRCMEWVNINYIIVEPPKPIIVPMGDSGYRFSNSQDYVELFTPQEKHASKENEVWMKNNKYILLLKKLDTCSSEVTKRVMIEEMFNGTIPRITVLVPTKNRGWCIENALKSILEEDFPNYEVIVIDCASTDDTAKRVAKYKNVIFETGDYKSEWDALNRGLNMATGDYFVYLADDDLHIPNTYTILALYLNEHPETFGVFGYGFAVSPEKKQYPMGMKNTGYQIPDFNNLIRGNYIPGNCIMHKRMEERFNELDPYGNDYDMWLLLSAKYGFDYIPINVGTVMCHAQTGSNTTSPDIIWGEYRHHRDLGLSEYSKARKDNSRDFHIALFSNSYGRYHSGGSVQNHWNVVDALNKAGVDVTLICNAKRGNDGVPMMSYDEFFNMPKEERPTRFNVFHVMAGLETIFHLNNVGIKPIGGSNVVTSCVFDELADGVGTGKTTNSRNKVSEEENFGKTDCRFWIYQSKYQERCYRELMRYTGELYQFTNTIDMDKFKYIGSKQRPMKVLWVGSSHPVKGQITLEQLALRMPDIEFVALTNDNNITFKDAKNITVVFGVDLNKNPDKYGLGCIQVCCPVTENQPLGVLEGMATGLPCVAFNTIITTGISEIIQEGVNGYLVPNNDIDMAEKRIRLLLEDKKLWGKMSLGARNYIEENFSYNACVPKFLNVYAHYLDLEIKEYVKKNPVHGDKRCP